MRAKISTLYQQSKSTGSPLLGDNNFDFWSDYVAAYAVYDRYFKDHFAGFFYFANFGEDETAANIHADFVDAVQAFLTINSKRYSELYRVQVLEADAYDIVNNYDLNETHSRTASGSASDTYGAREDTQSSTSIEGAREDTQSGTSTDGARTDSGSTSVGAQTSTTTRGIEGFNSSTFSDDSKDTTQTGAHTDTTQVSKGAQQNSNSSSLSKGRQENSDSRTATKGAQSDNHSNSETENISIRRYGNIGVQTAADVIGGHIELWTEFNFYKMIFDEIAKEYLLLDDCFENPGGVNLNMDSIILELAKISDKLDTVARTDHLDSQIGAVREDIADVHTKIGAAEDSLTDLITNMQ